jgi:hypothetical protein
MSARASETRFARARSSNCSKRGLGRHQNGKLLRLISNSNKFAVFLTMDKHLPRQQNLKDMPFAVVVLRAKSNRFEDTHLLMLEVFRRLAEFQPGHVYVLTQPD